MIRVVPFVFLVRLILSVTLFSLYNPLLSSTVFIPHIKQLSSDSDHPPRKHLLPLVQLGAVPKFKFIAMYAQTSRAQSKKFVCFIHPVCSLTSKIDGELRFEVKMSIGSALHAHFIS